MSNQPEGSQRDLRYDQDLVGTIASAEGNVEILVERVSRDNRSVWLFANETLDRIPELYQEISALTVDRFLPPFLVDTRLGKIVLYEWLFLFVGLPAIYLLTGVLNRILSPIAGLLLRRLRHRPNLRNPQAIPVPIRLLLVALFINWFLSMVSLPLLARQFWSSTSSIFIIGGSVWLSFLLNSYLERRLRRRLMTTGNTSAVSVLRLGQRVFDVLILFIGLLIAMYHFGINPAAAIAGLGVGGIAVALAAQKTLENVIGGISIISDRVVRVGDTLKVGDMVGAIEDIGLRSTRIRTLDRTILSVPNGQIANLSLENLSARDKFWFHPNLSLRYDATAAQIDAAMAGIGKLLTLDSRIEPGTARAHFIRFGTSSLDFDIFAYVHARDWSQFLEIQSELLLRMMEIVQTTGAHIAQPSLFLSSPSPIPAGEPTFAAPDGR